MYKYGDYSAYLNSLKNKKTCNGNYTNRLTILDSLTNGNNGNGLNGINGINARDIRNDLTDTNFESLFTDKSIFCTQIMIRYEKQITYIEKPLDVNTSQENSINRHYILQADNSIPNGTFKTIVNNININQNSKVILTTEKNGGFTIFNKRYTKYNFAYAGEDFQLLWNSGLDGWTVLKYNGHFE